MTDHETLPHPAPPLEREGGENISPFKGETGEGDGAFSLSSVTSVAS